MTLQATEPHWPGLECTALKGMIWCVFTNVYMCVTQTSVKIIRQDKLPESTLVPFPVNSPLLKQQLIVFLSSLISFAFVLTS